jgi:hypothetical protein
MAFDSFNVAFFTAGFLVPGFLWSAVLKLFIPQRAQTGQDRFVELLTLSCINYGLWSWTLFPIYQTKFYELHPYWAGIWFLGIIFVSPVILGGVTGVLQQKEFVQRFLASFGLRTVHPIARAWDWHFARGYPYWVLVTLHDGSQLYGLFGSNSFAASDPEKRDLYLEAQFRVLDNGEWAPIEDTAGVLIAGDQISTIEFRHLEVNGNDTG